MVEIYYKDGELQQIDIYSFGGFIPPMVFGNAGRIDGSMGYSYNQKIVENIKYFDNRYKTKIKIYTNSLDVVYELLNNTWDNMHHIFLLSPEKEILEKLKSMPVHDVYNYIKENAPFNKNLFWKPIKDLTSRELNLGHNIVNLYKANEFGKEWDWNQLYEKH